MNWACYYYNTVSDSYTALVLLSDILAGCIFHHHFQFFSNRHHGSLSGALLVYPTTAPKGPCPVRLKESGAAHHPTPSQPKSIFNYSSQIQKSYISLYSVVRGPSVDIVFVHEQFKYRSSVIEMKASGHRDEGVRPSCIELSVAVVCL